MTERVEGQPFSAVTLICVSLIVERLQRGVFFMKQRPVPVRTSVF